MTLKICWSRIRQVAALATFAIVQAGVSPVRAQVEPRTTTSPDTLFLDMETALQLALEGSEEVLLAEAGVQISQAGAASARSALFPQLSANLNYSRTLASPFASGGGLLSFPDSLLSFEPDTAATLEERVRFLERRTPSAPLSLFGSALSDVPFGQTNSYIGQLTASYTLWAGGRNRASARASDAVTRASEAALDDVRSRTTLDVAAAFLDALLAERMVEITRASAEQISRQLRQVRLELEAGNASELDALRVEVEEANIEPDLVAALNARDLALFELKRLVNLPAETAVALTGDLDGSSFQAVEEEVLERYLGDLSFDRADIRAAEHELTARRAQVDAARAAFLPTVSLSATVGGQAFPRDLVPSGSEIQVDASAGLAIQIPIFQGMRRKADVSTARATVRQAELSLAQLRERFQLELEQARRELRRAEALISARAQAVDQAARVYELTELSFGQGVATNLEIADARLALQRARLNEAQAVHDYYLALARLLRSAGEPAEDALERARQLLSPPTPGLGGAEAGIGLASAPGASRATIEDKSR